VVVVVVVFCEQKFVLMPNALMHVYINFSLYFYSSEF
jgi:hypothetical protein